MLRRPGPPFAAAALCATLLAITGVLAKLVPATERSDADTLDGFIGLKRPDLAPLLSHIAHLADPAPYALTALALSVLALARRRWRIALVVPVVFFLAGFTTEHLKHLLAHPRVQEWFGDNWIGGSSWPSGHSTAAMTMALCAVMVAPPRLRPTVAVLGAAFAVAVAYAILTLAWHVPSDVFGGYLVSGTWVMLAVGGLALAERRWPSRRGERETGRPEDLVPALVLAVGAAGVGIGLALTRPQALAGYAAEHTTFVAGALAIAVLAMLLATVLAFGLRGGGGRTPAR